jgi:hypothetical protein
MDFKYKTSQTPFDEALENIDNEQYFSELLGLVEDPENTVLKEDCFVDFLGMTSEHLGEFRLSWLRQAYNFQDIELEEIYNCYSHFAVPIV